MNVPPNPPPTLKRRLRRLAGRVLRAMPVVRRWFVASASYRILTREGAIAAQRNAGGWLRSVTAQRQQRAFEQLVAGMQAGAPRIDLKVAAEAVTATGLRRPSLLEIGCGGGYYSEILEAMVAGGVDYTGIDYSAAMVETARAAFPRQRFETGDATALRFGDASFDIVFNGASLMHILDYPAAIAEGARVARKYCIYHSLPIYDDRGTTYLRKHAYGAPVVEVVVNRTELYGLFERGGLRLIRAWPSVPYDVHPATPEHSSCETFLLAVTR